MFMFLLSCICLYFQKLDWFRTLWESGLEEMDDYCRSVEVKKDYEGINIKLDSLSAFPGKY